MTLETIISRPLAPQKGNMARAIYFDVVALLSAPVLAQGILTSESPFIDLDPGAPTGSSVLAIINSGESIGGFTFLGLPDGTGLAPVGDKGTIDVFVVHEETTVPFFDSANFQDSSISRLTLSTASGGVLAASVALPPEAGFLRFCSAFLASPAEGYSFCTLFTGEESNDIVNVTAEAPYGEDPAIAPMRQAGYAVALDVHTGNFSQIARMGRFNHENTITVPGGWKGFTMLSTTPTIISTCNRATTGGVSSFGYRRILPAAKPMWRRSKRWRTGLMRTMYSSLSGLKTWPTIAINHVLFTWLTPGVVGLCPIRKPGGCSVGRMER
jgi:hypothetical protein